MVELKGCVACEIHSHEVLLTELLFTNVFGQFEPPEIAALLSCMIFQQVYSTLCIYHICMQSIVFFRVNAVNQTSMKNYRRYVYIMYISMHV